MVMHSSSRSTSLLATGKSRTDELCNKDDPHRSDVHVRNVFTSCVGV